MMNIIGIIISLMVVFCLGVFWGYTGWKDKQEKMDYWSAGYRAGLRSNGEIKELLCDLIRETNKCGKLPSNKQRK